MPTCKFCEDTGYKHRLRPVFECKGNKLWLVEDLPGVIDTPVTILFGSPENLMPAHPMFDEKYWRQADPELICLAVKLC